MTPPSPAPRAGNRPPKLPLALLGLMTVLTLVGPFVIFIAIRGGPKAGWPPDRPVEWWTLNLICGAVVVLMLACVTLPLWSGRLR